MNHFTPGHEPSADARVAAVALRDYYVALVQAGFPEAQAERVIIGVLASAVTAQAGGDPS